jgi:hypothetical protein
MEKQETAKDGVAGTIVKAREGSFENWHNREMNEGERIPYRWKTTQRQHLVSIWVLSSGKNVRCSSTISSHHCLEELQVVSRILLEYIVHSNIGAFSGISCLTILSDVL